MFAALGLFAAPFLMLPTIWASRGPKWYWAGTLIAQVLFAAIACAWLLAPFAFWIALGPGWVLLWLLPTTIVVFALAFAPAGGG